MVTDKVYDDSVKPEHAGMRVVALSRVMAKLSRYHYPAEDTGKWYFMELERSSAG